MFACIIYRGAAYIVDTLYISGFRWKSDAKKSQFSSCSYENVAETLFDYLWKSHSYIFVIWSVEGSYVALHELCGTLPTNACYCYLCGFHVVFQS